MRESADDGRRHGPMAMALDKFYTLISFATPRAWSLSQPVSWHGIVCEMALLATQPVSINELVGRRLVVA